MSLDPMKAPQFVALMLKRNKVVLVSATYCTFCHRLKSLLIEIGVKFVSIEIDVVPNGRDVFKAVAQLTDVHTVPQVFVKGKFLGGYDEIIDLANKGTLPQFLH